ncbi:DUF7845 domain-containing protein [Haloarchaeobius sp. DT45]|uniref:DUF7845 domain-containing protein n=1 Tax=Haloarchaeobius sp. DT45 TaxID=3446116 RepID=UPI003F6CB99C
MTFQEYVRPQCHEFDVHLHFTRYALKPYYALDSVRKDHPGWQTSGKPTATFGLDGDTWAACFDYQHQPIIPPDPAVVPSYSLETAPLFRVHFVAKDSLYDDERADQSKRIRGGTITVRPRWPDMKNKDEETGRVSRVRGYMDIGQPYIDVQVQGSNIDFDLYLELVQEAMAAFGIHRKYFADPARTSNINDAAVYVRPRRSVSGSVYAADGPIERIHQLLESDRSGVRRHHADHRKIPGYHVATTIDAPRARQLVKGHSLGKEIKHYYPEHPENREPDEPLYHPKVEVSLQANVSMSTVWWEKREDRPNDPDRSDLRRELEEVLLNVLDWSGLSVGPNGEGGTYFSDAYFKRYESKKASRKSVQCPLPKIENQQEARVIQQWRNLTGSDAAVIDHLLTDGGVVSPSDVADSSGYCYRTIREALHRLEDLVKWSYGRIEFASDYQKQLLLDRVRAQKENFEQTVNATVAEVADRERAAERSAWAQWRRQYNVTVQEADTHYQTWRIEYAASDEQEARRILQSGRTAFKAETGRHSTTGIHVVIEIDGRREVVTDLAGFASSTGIRGVLQKYGKEFDRVRDELAEYYGGTDADSDPR